VWPRCESCDRYHKPGTACPKSSDEYRETSKWRVSKGFNTGSWLYNFWAAKKSIAATGVAVLVEGPGDVWRLREAGVENVVALFGCDVTEEQQIALERSGAIALALLLDSDDAGSLAKSKLEASLVNYRVVVPQLQLKDVGDTPLHVVQETLVPCLKSIRGY
jgi:DNA primase